MLLNFLGLATKSLVSLSMLRESILLLFFIASLDWRDPFFTNLIIPGQVETGASNLATQIEREEH